MNHVYEVSTGRLHSSTVLPVTNLDAKYVVVALPDGDEVGIWNTSSWSFDPRPPSKKITKIQFLELFADSELEAIVAKSKENTAQGDKVGVFLRRLDARESIDLADSRMITAVNGMEALGLIAVDRAAEILA